jgi:hypothetical protein
MDKQLSLAALSQTQGRYEEPPTQTRTRHPICGDNEGGRLKRAQMQGVQLKYNRAAIVTK